MICHSCILTVLWDTKHIKQSLIIWADAGKLVSCVFNAKYCFSSACTISFYNLVICDFVLPPDTQKIWVLDETFLCYCIITRVPQPWTRREVQMQRMRPSDMTQVTASISLTRSCDTGKSSDRPSRITCDNRRVRWEWYCMVNPDLSLSEPLPWFYLCGRL